MRLATDSIERRISSEQELLDYLLNYKLDTTSVQNSEVAIKTVCEVIDSLKNKVTGHELLSITSNTCTLLHLVNKRDNTYNPYKVITWKKTEKIEKGIESKRYDSSDEDILTWAEDLNAQYRATNEGFSIDAEDLVDYLISESLTGYCISKKKFTDQCEFMSSNGKVRELTLANQSPNSLVLSLKPIVDYILKEKNARRLEIRSVISNFVNKLDCDKLSLRIVHSCIKDSPIYIGKITKVLQNDNARTYQVKIVAIDGEEKANEYTLIAAARAGITGDYLKLNNLSDLWIAGTRPASYDDAKVENFGRIPYNHIDEGRILVSIPRCGGSYDIIFGPDPRIDKEPEEHLKTVLAKYVDILTKNLTKLNGTGIVDGKISMSYDSFESSVAKDSQDVKPLQIRLKALKKMVDEYKYIVQKQKAVGTDVNISDKVKYNHAEGKVSYNDFSIAVDDEMLKQRLFQTFESYLVTYYRGETTEETILNDILDKIFQELKNRVYSYTQENSTINVKLNGKVLVKLDIKTTTNKAKLLYLNDQRFNKNEIITVLREITCYRSQEEANRFITNIGKLGLSVYVGITSGYETTLADTKKLFRFKKLKGRSNYVLILDTVEIPIKGKELINTLFTKFIGDPVPYYETKIPRIVFESVEKTSDYVKYRFLIDSAYESFKERSETFLKKKVADVQGEFVKYWNVKNKKNMQAITLIGMSGHRYIVAYDNKDSYVFIDPELKNGEKTVYENGKYVCMIDQSNIKSNIGFDTVISKLLALKNDSIIAETIYNLEEELSE